MITHEIHTHGKKLHICTSREYPQEFARALCLRVWWYNMLHKNISRESKRYQGAMWQSDNWHKRYYRVLLILIDRRGGGEDFIERTLALHTSIIKNPAGFSSGLVPLFLVSTSGCILQRVEYSKSVQRLFPNLWLQHLKKNSITRTWFTHQFSSVWDSG